MNRLLVFAVLAASVLALPLLAACTSRTPTPTPSPTPTATPTPSPTPTPMAGPDPIGIAQSFLQAMAKGDYAAAEAMEDPTMAAAAPAAALAQIAGSLVAQYGAFQSLGSPTLASPPPQANVTIPATFAYAVVDLNVAVSPEGKVTGLHRGSVTMTFTPTPAPYVNPQSFTESDVTVGSAPWTLPGTLTMPKGTGPFPAVVLVAGSGPADRNETIGPNKPFQDLAWGLASQGIAVLRYDKRTLVYGQQMAQLPDITVKQETTDDAVAAIGLLRSTPKVDPSRVFLVGHSLGAYLAPRIAAQVPGQLAGIAMLEAPSSSLLQLLLIQTQYLISLQGTPTEQEQQQLDTIKQQVALAESPDLSPSTPASELPGGVPASYWLDLRTYDPLKTAASLNIPMLFTQGGRDYQVPPSQLQPWEQALAGKSNVTFKVYPNLDHLLFAGTGPSTPSEYTVPNHVAGEVVSDLAAWVLAH